MIPPRKVPPSRNVRTGDREFENLLRRAAKCIATRKKERTRKVTKNKRRRCLTVFQFHHRQWARG